MWSLYGTMAGSKVKARRHIRSACSPESSSGKRDAVREVAISTKLLSGVKSCIREERSGYVSGVKSPPSGASPLNRDSLKLTEFFGFLVLIKRILTPFTVWRLIRLKKRIVYRVQRFLSVLSLYDDRYVSLGGALSNGKNIDPLTA